MATDLACIRGGRRVFEGIGFAVGSGESLLLTGPNGSGKTTLLRLIAGLLEPVEGTIDLSGKDDDLTIGQCAHLVGHLDALKPSLSIAENLIFWADFMGGGAIDVALASFNLTEHRHMSAALLSAGQKRRLALSRLSVVQRPLWLLDEPSVGLDKNSRRALAALAETHLAGGGLIVASSHTDLGMKFTHKLELRA